MKSSSLSNLVIGISKEWQIGNRGDPFGKANVDSGFSDKKNLSIIGLLQTER